MRSGAFAVREFDLAAQVLQGAVLGLDPLTRNDSFRQREADNEQLTTEKG